MKPTPYWLNQLPDGYRERALANCRRTSWRMQRECINMPEAVNMIGVWRETREGYDFWKAVQMHYWFRLHSGDYGYRPLPPLPT